jgi:hypothetical protein
LASSKKISVDDCMEALSEQRPPGQYCVRNFPGGPEALADACRRLLDEPVARAGYLRIAAKFGAEDAFGPHTVSLFLGASGEFDDMSQDQLRVDAHRGGCGLQMKAAP